MYVQDHPRHDDNYKLQEIKHFLTLSIHKCCYIHNTFHISSDDINFKLISSTYFRLSSGGSFMSFCILTLIMSPGVPRIPPQPPANAAIPSRIGKEIGSPFGETFCLATYKNETNIFCCICILYWRLSCTTKGL